MNTEPMSQSEIYKTNKFINYGNISNNENLFGFVKLNEPELGSVVKFII